MLGSARSDNLWRFRNDWKISHARSEVGKGEEMTRTENNIPPAFLRLYTAHRGVTGRSVEKGSGKLRIEGREGQLVAEVGETSGQGGETHLRDDKRCRGLKRTF